MNERNNVYGKKKKDKRPTKVVHTQSAVVNSIINEPPSDTDPFGSYTGKPKDPNEVPVQDADDL